MDNQETPASVHALQGRPVKRACQSPPGVVLGDHSIADAVALLMNDAQVPAYLKTIVGHLLDRANMTEELILKNRELEERLRVETEEKLRLQNEVVALKDALFK